MRRRFVSWRRFLVLAMLMVWQGGFVFYSAVVIPTAMSVLDPPVQQSFVTLVVTRRLNALGAIALAVLGLELLAASDGSQRRRMGRWSMWAAMTVALACLFWVHPRLEAMMDLEHQTIPNREALYPLHRVYLIVSALQWLCGVVHLWLTLQAWRDEDRDMNF